MRLLADWYAEMRGLGTTLFCLHRWLGTSSRIERRTRVVRDLLITSSGAGLAPEGSSPRYCCHCGLLGLGLLALIDGEWKGPGRIRL